MELIRNLMAVVLLLTLGLLYFYMCKNNSDNIIDRIKNPNRKEVS